MLLLQLDKIASERRSHPYLLSIALSTPHNPLICVPNEQSMDPKTAYTLVFTPDRGLKDSRFAQSLWYSMVEDSFKAVLTSPFHRQVNRYSRASSWQAVCADSPLGYPVLNVSSSNDLVFIYTNYRVNAFGLLPGKEIAADPMSDLNPGLLDQHAALKWTNRYVSEFGGDPRNVSIWGQSAGGGSVVAQVIAQNGKTSPSLFSKALASSPFWPKTYKYNAPQAQALYDSLADLTGCSGPNSLQCLKMVDVQAIRNASLAISVSHTYNTSSYSWSPVIDGTFLTQRLSSATAKGQVDIDYVFGMYNLHEGENFIPPGFQHAESSGSPLFNSSVASLIAWLKGYLPGLSDRDRSRVLSLYPAQASAEGLPSYNTTYVRAGLIFRDSVLACPAYWMASAARKESYLGEYTIAPAKHASDTIYVGARNFTSRASH